MESWRRRLPRSAVPPCSGYSMSTRARLRPAIELLRRSVASFMSQIPDPEPPVFMLIAAHFASNEERASACDGAFN